MSIRGARTRGGKARMTKALPVTRTTTVDDDDGRGFKKMYSLLLVRPFRYFNIIRYGKNFKWRPSYT
jgi:hypothetical protein